MCSILGNPLRPQLVIEQDRCKFISEFSNWSPVISEVPPQSTKRGGVELSLRLTHQVTTIKIANETLMFQ